MNNLLIVSLGSIGKRHLKNMRGILGPKTRITVLRHLQGTDDVPEYADGIIYSLDDDHKFDAALICNPAPFHLPIAMKLAERGVHLFIEKPLSHSVHGIHELIELCEQKFVQLLIGYDLRYCRSLVALKKVIDDGLIGRPVYARASVGQYLPEWRKSEDYRKDVSARGDLGGGALLELSHEVDYVRWILGEITSVSAALEQSSDLKLSEGVEDVAELRCRFRDHPKLIGTIHMNMFSRDVHREMRVEGTLGSVVWDAITDKTRLFKDGVWADVEQDLSIPKDDFLGEMQHFIRCCRGEAKPEVSGKDGLKLAMILEAARESAATNKVVVIDQNRDAKRIKRT